MALVLSFGYTWRLHNILSDLFLYVSIINNVLIQIVHNVNLLYCSVHDIYCTSSHHGKGIPSLLPKTDEAVCCAMPNVFTIQ